MSSIQKIVIGAVTTVSIIGVSSYTPVTARWLNLRQGVATQQVRGMQSAFQPDPSAPPLITQGSGTR